MVESLVKQIKYSFQNIIYLSIMQGVILVTKYSIESVSQDVLTNINILK